MDVIARDEHGHDDSLPLAERMRLLADQADDQHIRDWADEVEALSTTNRGAVAALREIARMEPDPNEGVRPLDDLIDRMKGEAERALDRLGGQ